jgi:hypothetical protein
MLLHLYILAFAILPATGDGQHIEEHTVDRIADAIFRSEHSQHHPYGVMIPSKDPRTVCENTIRHAWVDFERENRLAGSHITHGTLAASSLPFISFLGHQYCPPSVDPVGFKNWTNNVYRILQHSH